MSGTAIRTRDYAKHPAPKAPGKPRKAATGKARLGAAPTTTAFARAKEHAQRQMQRSMVHHTQRTAKAAATFSKKLAAAVTKTATAMVGALAGMLGAAALLLLFCTVLFIAAVAASPFGIFFADEPAVPGAVPPNVAVAQINAEYADKLEALQAGGYDSVVVHGAPPDWRDVIAVFACKTTLADNGVDVATLDADRVDRLRAVFWDMTVLSTEIETIQHEEYTETILHITITAKTAEDMRAVYAFTKYQNEALDALLQELSMLGGLLGDLSIRQEDAAALLGNLPEDLAPERRAVVECALSLVGKVNYFWGGKSSAIGWDSRWGTTRKVTAAGSPTTGTYRPYGLDCSGYVDWVFNNAMGYVIGHGGGAHMQHTYCTEIAWAEAQPGDLVFYPDDSHVGIVGGWDANGNLLVIHCSSSANNVVITGLGGFTAIGRPDVWDG